MQTCLDMCMYSEYMQQIVGVTTMIKHALSRGPSRKVLPITCAWKMKGADGGSMRPQWTRLSSVRTKGSR